MLSLYEMYSKLCSIKIESNFPYLELAPVLLIIPMICPSLPQFRACKMRNSTGNVLAAQTDSADLSIPSFLRQLVLSPAKRMSET